MRQPRAHSRPLATLLVLLQTLAGLPSAPAAQAPAAAPDSPAAAQGEGRRTSANRRAPSVKAPDLEPRFSEAPTDAEISRARIFESPLVSMATAEDPASNRALADAILAYTRADRRDDLSAFREYLDRDPSSPWRASLLANLSAAYRQAGYFSRALSAAQEAWDLAREREDALGRSTAEIALGQLAALHSRLGHMDELEALLGSLGSRPLRGAASQHVSSAREALVMMRERPGVSFRCGPLAVLAILELMKTIPSKPETSR